MKPSLRNTNLQNENTRFWWRETDQVPTMVNVFYFNGESGSGDSKTWYQLKTLKNKKANENEKKKKKKKKKQSSTRRKTLFENNTT